MRTEKQESHLDHLAEKARGGDRAAFEKLLNLLWGDVFRMVYYRTFSRPDAEDLTQEIFMKAFSHRAELKDPKSFRPWLFSIAINQVRDFLRKKRVWAFFSFVGGGKGKEEAEEIALAAKPILETLMQREFWKQIRGFSEGLSTMEREVFLLRFADELTIQEIAEALKKGESAVKTYLYRAIGKFKKSPGLLRLLRED